jgi:hypothetical protein
MSFCRVAGTESLILCGTGFAASSVVGTIEVIYHVEAMTNPNYAVLVRPTGQAPRTAGSQTIDQVLTSVHRIPRISFADVVQTVGDAMLGEIEGRVGAAAGGAVSGLGGMLGRAVGGGPGTMIQRQMETHACGERWEIGLTALVSFPNWSR